jgi:hypothetical protein
MMALHTGPGGTQRGVASNLAFLRLYFGISAIEFLCFMIETGEHDSLAPDFLVG